MENNILIAEFMGIKTKVYSDTPTITYYNFNNTMETKDTMKYHTHWAWLIPVVEKISDTVIKGIQPFNSDQLVRVEIVPNGYVKISELRDTPIFSNVAQQGSLIAATYDAVSKFVQWYKLNHDEKHI